MMYKPAPGIVLTSICGVNYLIPTRKASETCSEIRRMSLVSAASWDMIQKGKNLEDVFTLYRILTKKPEDEVKTMVLRQLDDMCEKGFLQKVEDAE